MSTWAQIPCDDVAGRELQPVAKLAITVEALTGRGLTFTREQDDLGDVEVAALQTGDTVFLLRLRHGDPLPGVTVHTITAGDPTEQLAQLTSALGLAPRDVRFRWDGHTWHESPAHSAA